MHTFNIMYICGSLQQVGNSSIPGHRAVGAGLGEPLPLSGKCDFRQLKLYLFVFVVGIVISQSWVEKMGMHRVKNGSRLAEHHVCRWQNAMSLAGWTLLQVAPCPLFGNIPNLLVAKSIQVVFLGQTQFCHWNWKMEPTDFQPTTSRTSGAPPRVKAIVLRQALMAWHVSGNTWSLTTTLTSGLMIKTRDITWKSLRKCYRPHWPMMRLVRAASTLWQQVLCHIWSY